MKKLFTLALLASLFGASDAYADFTAKDASLATITFKNPAVCASVVCVPVFQIYDGTNVITLTTAGADAVSNTLTGVPMYARNLVFNGTTWDRWQGAVTNAGTFAVQAAQSGTWNITNISGTVSLPNGAATSANQPTNAAQGSATSGQTGNLMQGAVTTAAPAYTTAQTSPLSLTTSGALRTDSSATTQPVSGTVTANQGGTWNINNISGTVSLPTGAATAAKQPALGTAGTASADVLTVQGIAAMTALKVDGSAVTQPVSAAILPLPSGAATSANQTNASQKTQIVDGAGNVIASTSNNLNVQCANCSGSGVSAADAATFTAGTSLFAPVGGQFTTGGATACVTGHECTGAMTADRALFINLADIGGSVPSATNPLWMAGAQAASTTMQNAAVANGNGTSLTVTGYQTALVNVNCSVACSGGTTINFEGTDSTGTFFSVAAFPVAGTSTAVSTATTSGQFWVPVAGLTTIRARISAYSAGTITVTGTPVFGVNASLSQVANANANGQQTMANSSPVVIASNQSAITVNNATAANLLATVVGPTAVGSAAANPPVLIAGTANAGATGNVQVAKVTSGGVVSTDVSTVNGVTTLTGTGAVGTGAQRVAVGTDTATIAGSAPGTAGSASSNVLTVQGVASMTPILANPGTAANWAVGATASAPPANSIYLGANASGATGGQLRGLINCDNHVFKHITTATDTLAVQGVASQTIFICGWRSRAAGTATWFLENTASANANCASANTQITGVASEVANSGDVTYNPIWGGLKNTSGNGLCINSTGTGGVDIDIWYTQF